MNMGSRFTSGCPARKRGILRNVAWLIHVQDDASPQASPRMCCSTCCTSAGLANAALASTSSSPAHYWLRLMQTRWLIPAHSGSFRLRSEEHTSELQSREKLVC